MAGYSAPRRAALGRSFRGDRAAPHHALGPASTTLFVYFAAPTTERRTIRKSRQNITSRTLAKRSAEGPREAALDADEAPGNALSYAWTVETRRATFCPEVLSLSPIGYSLAFVAQAVPADAGGGIWDLFLGSTTVGKFVLAVLLAFSLASWAVMISKIFQLRRARIESGNFLDVFRTSKRFSEVNAAAGEHSASPLVGIFQAGYVEVDAQVKASRSASVEDSARYIIKSMDGVERTLRRAVAVELQELTRNTYLLATTASASPFIGLFGTVWGIMVAFNDIGVSGSTSIVAVAPGIAEALINTSAGLAAAIPALVGYNVLSSRIRLIRDEMSDFVLEFINLAERNFT
jgi:biopolymer transport protein TolQ